MKRILAGLSLVALTATAATAATTPDHPSSAKAKPKAVVKHHDVVKVAPADEYFGKLKLSILGIRNTIKDVGANIDIDAARWQQQASKASFAEDAIHDWERKYPHDTWLAKTVFALERMYAKLDSDEGRYKSLATMRWLVRDWPSTWYGRTGKREIAQGKVGHPVIASVSQPSPAPAQAAAGVATGTSVPAPAASAAATNSASAPVPASDASVPAAPVPTAVPTPNGNR